LRFNDVLASWELAQLDKLAERLARKRRSYLALREELRAQEIGAGVQYRFLAEHPPYAKLDDAGRIGRAVKNSGVSIKRWPG
jgi:dTDP-4-amino-4,6-dideoxygalactose transaminase